ncbi:restriction endonuclease type II-like protein [Syncephalis fuscata]|nr:restriction endonuclease type II-like protein [Syncephalis fuscata]
MEQQQQQHKAHSASPRTETSNASRLNESTETAPLASLDQQAQLAVDDLVSKIRGGRVLLEERRQDITGQSTTTPTNETIHNDGGFVSLAATRKRTASPTTAEPPTITPAQVPVSAIVTTGRDNATAQSSRVRQTPLETTWRPASINSEGNSVLRYIKNVSWEWGENLLPDYVVGVTQCILYLSLRYHRLRPEYIYDRIQKLGNRYVLRVLLVQVDVTDHQELIRELTRLAMGGNMTLFLAWSAEEAGRYIETFKAYEHRPPDAIRERVDDIYLAKLTKFLTGVKSITKTDVLTLVSHFNSVKRIIEATPEELSTLPGFGEQKVRRLCEAFSQPFITRE